MTTTKGPSSNSLKKSYFDVLGICCTSEVPLVERILNPMNGVEKVLVNVTTKTVIVFHDELLTTQIQIVKALNQARLDANIRVYGEEKKGKRWPSWYTIGCGLLLLVSVFQYLYHPLKWLSLAAAIFGLPPILSRCYGSARNFAVDINILVLIAVGGTVAMQDYIEAASVVFLFTIAEWLESRASYKATAVMSSLMSMAPQKAVLAENGDIVDAKDVKLNTILAVKAGEVIPIDGIVVEGNCEVDEKSLTGEPFPVTKQMESKVLAGTINLNGYISVKTTALADDCAVAKMAKLVEEAQNTRSKTQRLIDNCAKYYTPAVVLLSVLLAAIPAVLKVHNLKHWFHLALVVLVSACPCALILSTPVATFCALTKAATNGLLIKGGDYLEILAKIKVVAFDKTGTITRGEFSVTDFQSISQNISLDNLIYWVASIESKSSHPMAAALVDYGSSNSIKPQPENVTEYQNFPGEGISGEIDGKKIYVGNKKMATRARCEIVSELKKEGQTIGYVFLDDMQIGTFSVADTCRTGVAEAIKQLKGLGLKTAMLTGDSHSAAMRVQDQLGKGLDFVHADLLPQDKVKFIKELKKQGPTAMVGDGVNDAPALASADIGISMGIAGSALATETSHITLMSNDIGKIPQAIRLARKTRRKIIENVSLSIVTKGAILALAVAGHPILWAAVLADVGTCLLVIFNSMLLLRGTPVTHPHHSHSSDLKGSHEHHRHGHCHDKKGSCGSKTHQKTPTRASTCNSNHVKENCCSQGTQDTHSYQVRMDDHQTCPSKTIPEHHHHGHSYSVSSCEKKDSTCRSISKHHHDHEGCKSSSTTPLKASSHIIDINNEETVKCEHPHNHHEHVEQSKTKKVAVDDHHSCGSDHTHHGHNDHHEHVEHSKINACKGSKLAVDDHHSCGFDHTHQGSQFFGKVSTDSNADHCHDHSRAIACNINLHNGVPESRKKGNEIKHFHDKEDCFHSGHGHGHSKCKDPAITFGTKSNDPIVVCLMETSCNNTSTAVEHWCNSFEKREKDACCKSYRKECGHHHQQQHGCMGVGMESLSEIITE
ncbi:hypothetical protein MKW98_028452 [Papaver atlanticum]|uniref:HMA domain-containing protein n=1 Tax=Papaver atlanticum TaxID=357466 RepID=A0AAD4TG47_9MAGN|nr:hypothetical protein MKW98_028452 [Papaver atlanticum]